MKSLFRVGALLAAIVALASCAFAQRDREAMRLYNEGRYKEALTLLREVQRDEPNNPSVYVALGQTLRKLGDRDAAREAWDRVIELDPGLRSVNDDAGFLRVYRSLGGTLKPGGGTPSGRSRGSTAPNPIIVALTGGNVYVAPGLKGDVDPARLEDAARAAGGMTVKIVAVETLYPYKSPQEMAAALREGLNLGEGVVVVGTPRRIGASSGRLDTAQIEEALKQAGLNQAFSRGGLTEVLVTAARAVSGGVIEDRESDADRLRGWITLGLVGAGGTVGFVALRRRRRIADAKRPVETLRRRALDDLSYVDGYLDLLPAGNDADEARRLRQSAYDEYATASALLNEARSVDDARRAQPMLEHALADLEQCRRLIDRATGGTGVAMRALEIPSLATPEERAAAARLKPVEEVRSPRERDTMQRTLEELPENERGVSFFSGRPMPLRELVPVTIVIDGQKREVMATRDEAEAIRRGETPPIRAFEEDGRQIPWYENRRYDPYRDYYGGWGGGGIGSLVDLYLLTHLFGGGIFGGWGHGYGHTGYGVDPGGGFFGGGGGATETVPEQDLSHAGGFDLFGQGDYDDTSADDSIFGGGGGGWDFGGGDSGGFDGGDFGGFGD